MELQSKKIFVTNHSQIDVQEWSNFVSQHPQGNIFQTPEMFEVNSMSNQVKSCIAILKDKQTQAIQGLVCTPILYEKPSVLRSFTGRAIAFGAPLANTPNDTVEIVRYFRDYVQRYAVYTTFINLYDNSSLKEKYESLDFRFEDHLNFLIDLTLGEEQLWSNISSTRRKQIKRAINRGLTIQISDEVDTQLHYKILKETYNRASIPLIDISLFENAMRIMAPKKYIKFFSAYDGATLVANRMVFTYKDEIYDWYAGNTTESSSKYPNDFLVWEVLKWGIKNNFKTFNFGGAGKPNEEYGVRDFKKTFGGKLVNYGDFTCIHSQFKYSLIQRAKKYFKKN